MAEQTANLQDGMAEERDTVAWRAPRRLGPVLGVVSGVLLAAELTLTRLLSVVLWYHFAFFAISVALFGLSLAALLVHFVGERIPRHRIETWFALGALGLCAGLLAVDWAFCNVAPNWFSGGLGIFTALTGKLLLLFLLAALPFFCGGFSVSLALTTYALEASKLYFWDLIGAAVGALSTIALLNWLGAPMGLVVLAAIAAGCAVTFASRVRYVGAAAALGCVLLASVGAPLFTLHIAKGISLDEREPEFMKWNAFSLVSVLPKSDFKGWGLAPTYRKEIPLQKELMIDMNAMTPLIRFDGDFERTDFVSHDLSAFVYRVRPNSGDTCLIGAGGGKDVIAALASGARQVTAVEVNPIIANDVMRGRYKDYSGNLYGRPDVNLVVEDGRSFVRRTDKQFDIVHLSMVDTSAASAAGAYALTENGLYTQQAFEDFVAVLRPGGVLSVSSVSLPDLWVGARLASIARAALRVERPEMAIGQAVLVLETTWLGVRDARMYTLLLSPDGFDEAMTERAIAEATASGFSVVWAPNKPVIAGSPERAMIQKILGEKDDAKLRRELAAFPLDVSATTDDRPFFFYQNRLSHIPLALVAKVPPHLFGNGLVLLAKIAAVAFLCVLALIALPLIFGGRESRNDRGSRAADLGYATCIGFGFLLVELGLLHRLSPHLGDPTAALGVVLVSLLIGSALGSALIAHRDPRKLRWLLWGVVVAVIVAAFVMPWLTELTRAWRPLGRALTAGSAMLALGVLLGVPLPAALARISARARGRVAWFWALNGGVSVLASVLSTLIALNYGATVTVLLGAAAYAVCALLGFRVLDSEGTADARV